MKNHYPKTIQMMFARLLAEAKSPTARMGLYQFEGMYAKLFEELCQHPSFDSFLQVEAELRTWNPERTKKLYVELLKRQMDKSCQRSHYRDLIRHLDTLETYPGGPVVAQSLASYWYANHKNRPAMKDELRQAGYLP